MKKLLKRFISISVMTFLFILLIQPSNAYAAEVKSVVTRDDGTWLFPLPQNSGFRLSDWAGCSGNWCGACIFGCSHANWGDPVHSSQLGHYGLDIGCGNVAVLASAPGTVYGGYCSGRGNYLVIEHPLNNRYSYYSIYQHLQSFAVNYGDYVTAGKQIGIAGNSGSSYGVHLHFEILLLKSGLGSALTNTNTLANYEGTGWLRDQSKMEGLLVTNPSTANYASASSCNMNSSWDWESIPYHCGSVTYTYNTSQVKIGGKSSVTSYATKAQASDWVDKRIGQLSTDMTGDNVCSDMDFIKEYTKFLGLKELNGTPANFSTMTLPDGYTRIKNWTGVDGFVPDPGDIAIWIGGPYGTNGHVGIVLAADGWNITKLAEISSNGGQGSSKITSRADNYDYFWGVIRPKYASSITKRTVSFKNYNGALLKMQTVKIGSSAIAPTTPQRDGYRFVRWSDTFTNVQKDMTIYPVYELIPTVTPTPITTPGAVTKLSATYYGYDDIALSWSKATNAQRYYIMYKKNLDLTYKVYTTTAATSYKMANLADGVKYTFKIVPYRTVNGKVYKGTGKAITKYTLKRVSTPKAARYNSKNVKLSWSKVTSASGYQISRSTSSSGTAIIKTVSSKYSSITIDTTKNKTYYYKVRCYVVVNNKKIYAPWSYVRAYKLK